MNGIKQIIAAFSSTNFRPTQKAILRELTAIREQMEAANRSAPKRDSIHLR